MQVNWHSKSKVQNEEEEMLSTVIGTMTVTLLVAEAIENISNVIW